MSVRAGQVRGGRHRPRPSLEIVGASATSPCPVRSGIYGISWFFMGVNGILTDNPGILGQPVGKWRPKHTTHAGEAARCSPQAAATTSNGNQASSYGGDFPARVN